MAKNGCVRYTIIFVFASISLILLLNAYQRWQRRLLFCETIRSQMSISEVLETMDKFGEFSVNQYEPSEGILILSVVPLNDFGTAFHYGGRGLELAFGDDGLGNVIERYHLEDGIRNLCN